VVHRGRGHGGRMGRPRRWPAVLRDAGSGRDQRRRRAGSRWAPQQQCWPWLNRCWFRFGRPAGSGRTTARWSESLRPAVG